MTRVTLLVRDRCLDVRRLLLVLASAVLGSASLPQAEATTFDGPLDPVCAEPGGQTDSLPQPRLKRATVGDVPVVVVLPPGYGRGDRRYPVLYLMHGAQGDEDSWIEYGGLMDDTAARPRRERAIVVMPRMGVITGLAVDWVDGWRSDATLVGRTLVRWTDRTYRTRAVRDHRAIGGYSGGALSATHVAQRFPRTFGHLIALSGPLDLSSEPTRFAAWPAFEAEKICAGDDPAAAGPLGDPLANAPAWDAFDPVGGVDRLRRTDVWLASGAGTPCDAADTANLVYPTAVTEPYLRQQTDAFSAALAAAGIGHVNQHRECGLHWWTTWRPALADAWDAWLGR